MRPGHRGQQESTTKASGAARLRITQSDAVFDAGSYWLATAANANSEPSPTNTNWQILAAGINNRGTWQSTVT